MRKSLSKLSLFVALGAVLSILAVACGGDAQIPSPTDEALPKVVRLVATEWEFKPAHLDIPGGEVVTLVVENRGRTVHGVELEGIHVEILAASGEAAPGHEEHEHKAEESHGVHLSVEPGEKRWVTFIAEESGTFAFYCTIPGHRNAGMEGTGVVLGEEPHSHS